MRNQSRFCSFLESHRKTQYEAKLGELGNAVKDAEEMHYRTVCFVKAAESNRREEALKFLFEVNHVPTSGARPFLGNDVKKRFIEAHEKRLRAHGKRAKENRTREQDAAPQPPLLLEAGDTSHYGILGVPRDASKKEIVRAYRQLALMYHPDKNNVSSSSSLTSDTAICSYRIYLLTNSLALRNRTKTLTVSF